MKVGKFDRGCFYLVLLTVCLLFEGYTGVVESWMNSHSSRYKESHARYERRMTVYATLDLATGVSVNATGLLDRCESVELEHGRKQIVDNDPDFGVRHVAYAPSGNSYRLAAIPIRLSKEEREREENYLYVLNVVSSSNRLSSIEIVSDQGNYFQNELVVSSLKARGYIAHVVTNDGKRVFICNETVRRARYRDKRDCDD